MSVSVRVCVTLCSVSLQLAYCVVQFMEKDATVTEYVRLRSHNSVLFTDFTVLKSL